MKEKTIRRLRYALISLAIICMTPLCEKGRPLNGAHPAALSAGRQFTCVIDLGNDMYDSHGLETGLHYELLQRFAKDNRCEIEIRTASSEEDCIDSLLNGKVDMVITHNDELAALEGISVSRPVTECSAWAVSSSDKETIRHINNWISYIKVSSEFSRIENTYRAYDPVKRAENGLKSGRLSPYDSLIKKYAAQLGWDWRMLAAVVYQESRFAISSRSHRGALGLMQVMPTTGAYYGIDDLLDPEQNLKAGTGHLMRLQKQFSKCGMAADELVKFTLAAYNAGEGRIADCRSFAAAMNKDCNSWSEIESLIPLMREDSILEEESVKLGKFQGYETIAYISNIARIYEAMCRII